MNIYLALDHKCLSPEKISSGRLGGTERFLLILARWLTESGHTVCSEPIPGEQRFDVAIHGNTYFPQVIARRHICWAGSWHTDAAAAPYDRVIFNSKFMASKYPIKSDVVPACFEAQIPSYTGRVQGHYFLVCTSNPNRHIVHTIEICDELLRRGIGFHWEIFGGNKLYSEDFPECFRRDWWAYDQLEYRGVVDRKELLQSVSRAAIFVYPNLSDESETECVAAIEAAVLGLPVILPEREPFLEIMGHNATYARDVAGFCDAIEQQFKDGPERIAHDMSRYSEATIMPRLLEIITETANS